MNPMGTCRGRHAAAGRGATTRRRPRGRATPRTAAWAPASFTQATSVADIIAEQRRLRRQLRIMRAFVALLLAAAIGVAGYPIVLQYGSQIRLAAQADRTDSEVMGWPYPKAELEFKAAQDYNRQLAESGQPVLGEAIDPFTAAQGGSQAHADDSQASRDTVYNSLLETGNGVMASIIIPKISVDLPVYHGTSERVLSQGSGHLYGTSLPVGGPSTHSVLTGHRGLVDALMFTRLDEVQKGDYFYIRVMGETLGYQVDRISVITPDDTSQLRITPGEDRVTLMTCTPYGVNTHRLLVSGTRKPIPQDMPGLDQAPKDTRLWTTIATGTPLILGLAAIRIRRHAPWRRVRHSTAWHRPV